MATAVHAPCVCAVSRAGTTNVVTPTRMNIEDVDPQADEQGRAYTRAPMPGILTWSAADGTSMCVCGCS